ncbi:MAG: phosphotransferase [Treponema sp.]|jgi:aminoglycoside phosphotransferase (APT) family kinase protein|nr:phosphotransferase [Treponema sp.]
MMGERKIIVDRETKKIYLEDGKVYKVMGSEYPASDVFNEALNLAAVGETDLKVPKLLEVTKIDGNWAIVWEYIEGVTLAELMEKEPARIDERLNRFVDIQVEMHRHSASRLALLKDKLQRKINASGLDATTRYELSTRLDSLPRHTKLCHGDFNPSNIIITSGNEAYIIDWSHATAGNASADAVQTWMQFVLAKQFIVAEKYFDLFCLKTDTAKQYVDKWIPIVAASHLNKATGEDHNLLHNWASVVEYE